MIESSAKIIDELKKMWNENENERGICEGNGITMLNT